MATSIDVQGGDLLPIENVLEPESFEQKQNSGVVMDNYTTLHNIVCALENDTDQKFCITYDGSVVAVVLSPERYASMRGIVNLTAT